MDSFQLLSSVYMLGFDCSLWSKEEIIDWCDKVIEAKENPPYQIIEISLMSKAKIDDIGGKLFEVCKEAKDDYAVKLVLSILHEKLKRNQLTIERAIKCTARLLVYTGLYWESEYYNLYSMDDCYDLAKDGIHHDLSDVIDTYIENLEVYSQYFNRFKKLYYKEMNSKWAR